MRDIKLRFSQFTVLLCDICSGGLVFLFFCYQKGCGAPDFLLWVGMATVSFCINILLRRRRASFNFTAAVNILLCAACGSLMTWRLVLAGAPSFTRTAVFFCLCCFPVIHSLVLSGQGWNYNHLALYLDGMAACEAFILMISGQGNFGDLSTYALWMLIALIFSVISLALYRMRSLGSSGSGLLAVSAAAAAAILAAGRRITEAAGLAAGVIWKAITYVWSCVRFVLSLLGRFFVWLFSLLPDNGDSLIPMEAMPSVELNMSEAEEIPGPDPRVIAAIGAALLLFVVWKIFRANRGRRMSALRYSGDGTARTAVKREKGRFRLWLGRLFAALRFELAYIRNRSSAEGLLTYTERLFAKGPSARRRGESAPQFLRRIASADMSAAAPHSPGPLIELASALESVYYSKTPPALPRSFASAYRRSLRAAFKALSSEA